MNGASFINYLLLAIFIAGTSYVTYVTVKEIYNDLVHSLKALKRLLRIHHRIHTFFKKTTALFLQPTFAECCKSDKSTNKYY